MRQVFFSGILLGILVQSAAGAEIIHTTATLSQPRWNLAAASVDALAILAGGYDGTAYSSVVDVYDSSSGVWTTDALSAPRGGIAAVAVGNLAIFAGGLDDSGESNVVDVFHAPTGTWTTAALSQPRSGAVAVTIGDKVMFAGGTTGASASDVIDVFDSATGAWSTAALPYASADPIGVACGNKVLFVLDRDAGEIAVYDAGADSWTLQAAPDDAEFSSAAAVGQEIVFICGDYRNGIWTDASYRYDPASNEWTQGLRTQPYSYATVVGNTAFFAGYESSTNSFVLDIVRANWGATGTLENPPEGDLNRDGLVGSADLDVVRVGWTNLCGCSQPGDGDFRWQDCTLRMFYPSVFAFDADAEVWTVDSLSDYRYGMAATSAADAALFAGGYSGGQTRVASDVVDIYRVVGPSAVPEPSLVGSLLAGIGMLGVLRRRAT